MSLTDKRKSIFEMALEPFGRSKAKEMIMTRCRGTTTAIAFRMIGEAMLCPNQPIQIIDHYRSHEADRYLMETIKDIIYKLELEGFKFDKTRMTFTFWVPE